MLLLLSRLESRTVRDILSIFASGISLLYVHISSTYAINTWLGFSLSPHPLYHPPPAHSYNSRDLHFKLYTRLAVKCEWRNCRLQMKESDRERLWRRRGEREIAYVDVMWTYAKWIHKIGLREAEDDVSWAHAAGCNPQTSIRFYM